MKKTTGRKLGLNTETLVALQPEVLADVQGGAEGRSKSWLPFSCVSADGGRSCSVCPKL